MKQALPICALLWLFFSCSGSNESKKTPVDTIPASDLTGSELANVHCARCHAFVPPELLPKASWEFDVLPAMGNRMGIYNGKSQPDSIFGSLENAAVIKKAGIFPEKPTLVKADWLKIVDYYVANAPDTILPPKRAQKIKMGLRHFTYKEASYNHRPPLTSMVKILPENRGIVFGDGKNKGNILTFLTPELNLDYNLLLTDTPIDYHEKQDTLLLTTIGKNIFPNDLSNGTLKRMVINRGKIDPSTTKDLIHELQRPVDMAYGELNNDGREDVVACEYGDLTGKLVWFENQGNDTFETKTLNNRPGAITAIIKDGNNDGLNDIFTLMAQGDEGIFYYENQGGGTFTEKRLLSFLPLNGSQYMEMIDFNNDGFDDILYACGDNADKTPFLKEYHGIYIFLNDGDLNFTKSYFYPLNGAYKAIPRDFDLDGDLDIAAISYFPDYLHYPEESFVYLENKGDLQFDDFSFPEAANGRWIVMDAGDMDADGDIDLALGSFVFFLAQGDTTGLSKKWLTNSPSVIVLENTIK